MLRDPVEAAYLDDEVTLANQLQTAKERIAYRNASKVMVLDAMVSDNDWYIVYRRSTSLPMQLALDNRPNRLREYLAPSLLYDVCRGIQNTQHQGLYHNNMSLHAILLTREKNVQLIYMVPNAWVPCQNVARK